MSRISYTGNTDSCRDATDLDNNNVYSRSRCNNGWCAHLYEYYFEKDVALEQVCGVGAGKSTFPISTICGA